MPGYELIVRLCIGLVVITIIAVWVSKREDDGSPKPDSNGFYDFPKKDGK